MRGGKWQAVAYLMDVHQMRQRRACDVLQIDRSTVRCLSHHGDDSELRDAINEFRGNGDGLGAAVFT